MMRLSLDTLVMLCVHGDDASCGEAWEALMRVGPIYSVEGGIVVAGVDLLEQHADSNPFHVLRVLDDMD
jgi:hypothetical protein